MLDQVREQPAKTRAAAKGSARQHLFQGDLDSVRGWLEIAHRNHLPRELTQFNFSGQPRLDQSAPPPRALEDMTRQELFSFVRTASVREPVRYQPIRED